MRDPMGILTTERWVALHRRALWLEYSQSAGMSSKLSLPSRRRLPARSGSTRTMPSLMFTGRYGIPIDPRTLNRKLGRAATPREYVGSLFMNARHTCATLLVEPRCASARDHANLRHADQAVTMEIYANASSAATRSAAATWRHLALMCCCTLDEAWAVGELQRAQWPMVSS